MNARSSLFGRFLLIIIIPMMLLETITISIFYYRHWSTISDYMNHSVINEVQWLLEGVDTINIKVNNLNPKVNNLNSKVNNNTKNVEDQVLEKELFDYASRVFGLSATFIKDMDNGSRMLDSIDAVFDNDANDIILRDFVNDMITTLNKKDIQCSVLSIKYINSKRDISIIISGEYLNNQILQIDFKSTRIRTATNRIFILWVLGSAFFLIGIAWMFTKNQLRSIIKLTNALQNMDIKNIGETKIDESYARVGVMHMGNQVKAVFDPIDDDSEFIPSGSREIRAAGIAFIKMKKRIESDVLNKVEFLTHVAHDMRTPLTRMKLQLAVLDEKISVKVNNLAKTDKVDKYINAKVLLSLKNNLNEMDSLLAAYLKFAKGDVSEDVVSINIIDVANNVIKKVNYNEINNNPNNPNNPNNHNNKTNANKKNSNKKIKQNFSSKFIAINIQSELFERALVNILENALKFANKNILFSIYTDKDIGRDIKKDTYKGVKDGKKKKDNGRNIVYIEVDDDGPGIEVNKMDSAFKPFEKNVHITSNSNNLLYNNAPNNAPLGFGLGLAIAKKIIENNNGDITLCASKKLGGLKVCIAIDV